MERRVIRIPEESVLLASAGFTVIELMLAVAIIGVLSAVAIPQFGRILAKAQEGATHGNLGALRSALSIYYGDTEGAYPSDLNALAIRQKYINKIPIAFVPSD